MRKPSPPLEASAAARIVEIYVPWIAVPTSGKTVLLALRFRQGYNLSPWDALFVAAAMEARCERLYTEDSQHGQRIEGFEIVNPFIDVALAMAT